MSEDSTTPDLVELTRLTLEAWNHRDFDLLSSLFAPDAVWDTSTVGTATYEGLPAILEFLGDWLGAYDELAEEADEILDVGNGVTFASISQKGRPVGSSSEVVSHYVAVTLWVDGVIACVKPYIDVEEGRTAAKRLAEERG